MDMDQDPEETAPGLRGRLESIQISNGGVPKQMRHEGHPIDRGTTGENLTLSGLDWKLVRPGSRLTVGEVTLEITGPAHPCRKIAGSFADGDFSRLSAKIQPGTGRMYARVLTPGTIRPGDPVTSQT